MPYLVDATMIEYTDPWGNGMRVVFLSDWEMLRYVRENSVQKYAVSTVQVYKENNE